MTFQCLANKAGRRLFIQYFAIATARREKSASLHSRRIDRSYGPRGYEHGGRRPFHDHVGKQPLRISGCSDKSFCWNAIRCVA